MEGQDKKEDSDFFLSFSDLVNICKRKKNNILFCCAFLALLSAFFTLTRPIEYAAESTFREKGISEAGLSKSLSSFILGNGDGNESEAVTMMKSRKLMEELVKRMHLQGNVVKKERIDPFRVLSLMKKNLAVEYAYFKKKKTPAVATPPAELKVIDIFYPEEIPATYDLVFSSPNEFEVSDQTKKVIATGRLGTPVTIGTSQFTVVREGGESPQYSTFMVVLHPLAPTAKEYSQKFNIDCDRSDKGLLKLQYANGNRHLAALHLNALMEIYQDHSNKEHQRIANFQIGYLEKRHDEMSQDLEKLMYNHAHGLSSDVTSCGHHSIEKAMEFRASNLQEYKRKLLSINLEIQRFKKAKEDGEEFYDKFISETNPLVINTLSGQIRDLKQESDSLGLVIRNFKENDIVELEEDFSQQLKQIEENKLCTKEAKILLASLDTQKTLPEVPVLLNHPKLMVKFWVEKLMLASDEDQKNCRTNLKSYLENLIHFLDVQQRSIEERLAHQQPAKGEFEGINLNTARELFLSYSREMNDAQSRIAQHKYIVSQMEDPGFELTSLSTVLQDSVSAEMIGRASSLILSLRDADNRSSKEQERLKSELEIQKSFLANHINQTIKLLELREKLLKTKIRALQTANLALIQEQISILQEHMSEYIVNRLSSLEEEKELLTNYTQELQEEMALLPAKWMAGRLIDQQLNVNLKMVEEVTKLVESKNISNHLETIQSAPIDVAIAPLHPKPPRIILFTLLGAGLGAFLGLSWVIISSIASGIQASEANLRLAGQHVSGSVIRSYSSIEKEPLLDKDLETLRRLFSFLLPPKKEGTPLTKEKFALLIEGKGPRYAANLAELMFKTGLKILLMPISFDEESDSEELPGLLQYLEGSADQPKIVHGKAFDFISAGGICRFSNELISSPRLEKLMDTLAERYDFILAVSHASPNSAEAEALLEKFNLAVITLTGETLDELKGCIQLANQNRESKKITFLLTSSEIS